MPTAETPEGCLQAPLPPRLWAQEPLPLPSPTQPPELWLLALLLLIVVGRRSAGLLAQPLLVHPAVSHGEERSTSCRIG